MNPFLSGYHHDIFVSYAHEDTLGDWTVSLGADLQKALNFLLRSKIQGRSIDVWIDDILRRNVPLTEQLQCQVQHSALLLIAMSPFYLGSEEWCGKELGWFVLGAQSRSQADRRVFLIDVLPTEREAWPSSLGGLTAFPFYWRHPQINLDLPAGLIGDDGDKAQYRIALYTLAGQIRQQIEDLVLEAEAAVPRPAGPPPDEASEPQPAPVPQYVWLEIEGSSPDSLETVAKIRGILEAKGIAIIASADFGPAPREPLLTSRFLDEMAKAKIDCQGLVLLRLDGTASVVEWLLAYLSEVLPRRVRTGRAASPTLLIDAAPPDTQAAPNALATLRCDQPDFSERLEAWIDGLPRS